MGRVHIWRSLKMCLKALYEERLNGIFTSPRSAKSVFYPQASLLAARHGKARAGFKYDI